MNLGDLITPEGVIASLKAKNKKQALQEMSKKAADLTKLDEEKAKKLIMAARAHWFENKETA